MAIFNSLGSNYKFNYVINYVIKYLLFKSKNSDLKLKKLLEEKYQGKAILTYKGREALSLALKASYLPKESRVAINGFTCVAVYNAIEKAGFHPICLDIEKNNTNLNFSAEELKKAIEQNKNLKAVVIQNTLGYPCDIEKISNVCKENNLILIEDLAHCVGAEYPNNRQAGLSAEAASNAPEAGTVGDLTVLSFSQDKIIDAVSGGALVIRNKKILASQGETLDRIKLTQKVRDYFYPFLTYKIRTLYHLGLGKPYHFVLKKLNFLSKPMQENLYDIYPLPKWHCSLALFGFKNLQHQLSHRKKIAQIYAKNLNKSILSEKIVNQIEKSSNLRFPIFVKDTKDREELFSYLEKFKIYISDTWYTDVAPECPNAVDVSHKILNLPTHVNVSEKDAIKITKIINEFIN
jgi:perosamine synthetase